MGILIVDDTASQRLLLISVLKSAGYNDLRMANSAEHAFEHLGIAAKMGGSFGIRTNVDLILMDISMPQVDGIEACHHIKAIQELQDTPIIMVTASTETEDLEAAFGAGAIDYITKPPNRAEMLARVRSALRLKHEMDSRKVRERQLLDYVEQVGYVTAAAVAVEAASFDPQSLMDVAARTDALGRLARVFQQMASEIYAREQRLKQAVQQLQIEIDEVRTARQVAEITETDYFQDLERKVDQLRFKADGDS